MKKLLALLLALTMCLPLAACGKKTTIDDIPPSDLLYPSDDMTGPDKKTAIDDIPLGDLLYLSDDMTGLDLGLYCVQEEVTRDNVNYHIGAQNFTGRFESAVALSPMMNVTPMELIFFRLEPGADARGFARELEDKASLNKWVCVSAETVLTKTSGRTVLFFMGDKATAGTLSNCFDRMCQDGFRPEDHLIYPLADLTMESLYHALEPDMGIDVWGFMDGEELAPAAEGDFFHLSREMLSKVADSLVDTGYAPADDFDLERSYALALFRLKDAKDAEAFAQALADTADLSSLKGDGRQTVIALSGDVVVYFAGGGSWAWFSYQMEQTLEGRYRMTAQITEY